MKKVLCFGDSNTFGFNPKNGLRFPKDIRWTGVLQDLCKDEFQIIEAGCNNRTSFRNNPEGKIYTGHQVLPEYLQESPDIVILALGSNDLQRQYRTTLEEIEYGLEGLIKIVRETLPESRIIILSPTPIGQEVLKAKIFSFLFDETSVEKSKYFAEIYSQVALKNVCEFIDLTPIAPVSKIDGLHYEAEGHREIANAVLQVLKTL